MIDANVPARNQPEPPDSAWVGPFTQELHRAMWASSPDGPAQFRELFARRVFSVRGSDEDIRSAYAILNAVAHCVVNATAGDQETLQHLLRLVTDKGTERKRRAVIEQVQLSIEKWARDKNREAVLRELPLLLGIFDNCFLKLSASAIRDALRGSKHRSAALVAAKLSVAVRAFGDSNEKSSRNAFNSAIGKRPKLLAKS